MPIIEVENLIYRYGNGLSPEKAAIEDISLQIEEGELLAVIGHTGSGKSTLIQHLNGLLKPTSGRVIVDGHDIWESKASVRQARFTVGLCFQYPEYQLFEETVFRDIAFGPKNMGLDDNEIKKRVCRAAEYVGIGTELFEKSPFDLSGGQKRRVAIAGVMAMEPKVLVLDEPTAGLDPIGRDTILKLIKSYRETTGKTVILVSHSMEDVAKLATKVLVLNRSRLAMFGTVEEVFSRGDELTEMGLNVPQVTRIFMLLRQAGLPVSTGIYTVEQGRNELLRLVNGGVRP
ncbi:MAG: energy-coupling factor transporter ATPase [Clostridiales bacterium]|nr:energy-coupling factor transporter ATPase [Clostridiales bacterium]